MGTDRDEAEREPCPCGRGAIVIDRLTPDHGWSSGQWVNWEGRLECDTCRRTYAMYATNPSEYPRLALIADVREKDRRFSEWQSADRALMASDSVQALIDRLTNRIETEPSFAAKYRLVRELSRYYTYSTFNRHWRGRARLGQGMHSVEVNSCGSQATQRRRSRTGQRGRARRGTMA